VARVDERKMMEKEVDHRFPSNVALTLRAVKVKFEEKETGNNYLHRKREKNAKINKFETITNCKRFKCTSRKNSQRRSESKMKPKRLEVEKGTKKISF
jgi:hypothetical protein